MCSSDLRDQAEEGDLACKGETLVLLNAIGTGEEIEGTDDLLEMIVIVPGRGVVCPRVGEEGATRDD